LLRVKFWTVIMVSPLPSPAQLRSEGVKEEKVMEVLLKKGTLGALNPEKVTL